MKVPNQIVMKIIFDFDNTQILFEKQNNELKLMISDFKNVTTVGDRKLQKYEFLNEIGSLVHIYKYNEF